MASKTKHLPIQVGIIIYNESKRLPGWLKYWQPIAEHIIIIDQGSKDGTQDILKASGVDWYERLPSGNADIHWNDLIGISKMDRPLFRLGVDEFITRANIKKVLKVIKAHPQIMLWWMKRTNWIDGIDLYEHPEAKQLLGHDWQPIVSFGRPYYFSGRMHNWAEMKVPGEHLGYIDTEVAWVDHRRTLAEVVEVNESREHRCRSGSADDQIWFVRACQELVSGNYAKEGEQ